MSIITFFLEILEKLIENKEKLDSIDPSQPDSNYFARLQCNFNSTEGFINSQYFQIMNKFAESYDTTISPEKNLTLRQALRVISAYKVIMSPKVMNANMA